MSTKSFAFLPKPHHIDGHFGRLVLPLWCPRTQTGSADTASTSTASSGPTATTITTNAIEAAVTIAAAAASTQPLGPDSGSATAARPYPFSITQCHTPATTTSALIIQNAGGSASWRPAAQSPTQIKRIACLHNDLPATVATDRDEIDVQPGFGRGHLLSLWCQPD